MGSSQNCTIPHTPRPGASRGFSVFGLKRTGSLQLYPSATEKVQLATPIKVNEIKQSEIQLGLSSGFLNQPELRA